MRRCAFLLKGADGSMGVTALPQNPGNRRDGVEVIMIRIAAVVLALTLAATFAVAQSAAPDSENGRFTFTPVTDGVLRLDTRTGNVSLCSRREAGWACQVVPDERAVLEGEITRLQVQNGALKREMIARGVPLPAPAPQAERPAAPPRGELNLPSDAELDRVMTFMEKVWRRLLDMVDETKDRERRG
jgi:hypothetical protein